MMGVQRFQKCKMFQPIFLIFIFCRIKIGNSQITEIRPSFIAEDHAGAVFPNPGSVEENSRAVFKCTATITGTPVPADVYWSQIEIKMEANGTWIEQILCSTVHGITTLRNNTGPGGGVITAVDPNCLPNSLELSLQMSTFLPKYYRCKWLTFAKSDLTVSADIVLRTYSKPLKPVIEQLPSETPTENDQVSYVCTSTARPPPKLSFTYSRPIDNAELVHYPPLNEINLDSPQGTSNLTWTTSAIGAMNGEHLLCKIYDHLSGLEEPEQHLMSVFYGPVAKDDVAEEWNLAESDSKEIICSLDSHGSVTYVWYSDAEDESNKMPDQSSQTWLLPSANYAYVTGDNEVTAVYVCKATNSKNRNQSKTLKITLKIYTSVTTTTTVPSTTTTTTATKAPEPSTDTGKNIDKPKAGLQTWGIALIVIATLIVVAVVIAATWMTCRKRNSPAMQKKQAAANKKSNSGNNKNQNGDHSPGAQPDIIRNSYKSGSMTPIATLSSPDYRHSQHVEDYADAIDDKPRSRKPIQYSMDELNEAFDAPPPSEGGPPGYHTHDYRDYGTNSRGDSYSMQYGAAC